MQMSQIILQTGCYSTETQKKKKWYFPENKRCFSWESRKMSILVFADICFRSLEGI